LNNKIKYNPLIHNRKSIRLKGYDYTKAGLYFITICCQDRACLFGHIINGEMLLNKAEHMILRWYDELENKFPVVKCNEVVVMPNHFHCIIEIVESIVIGVWADLRVCTIEEDHHQQNVDDVEGSTRRCTPTSISETIQWFKTMTTNEYIRGVKNLGWEPFNGKIWERNYYEHIIRNEQSCKRIANYIVNNPKKWEEDKLK
jgi:putative transposase